LLSVLVERMIDDREKRSVAVADLVDVLFALTSLAFFWELTAGGRKIESTCRLIQALAADAVRRALTEKD
jgi:hypothetical protein